MARGNDIVVSADPKGVFTEGYLGAGVSAYPGQILERDATVPLKAGRHTYKLASPGSDGAPSNGPNWVLRVDSLQGRTALTQYTTGERVFLYCPVQGEELNLLVADIAGTGDTHPAGQNLMIQNGTGKLVVQTGSLGKRAQLLETITAPTADTLAWCVWN